jgi:hypothetical protein
MYDMVFLQKFKAAILEVSGEELTEYSNFHA